MVPDVGSLPFLAPCQDYVWIFIRVFIISIIIIKFNVSYYLAILDKLRWKKISFKTLKKLEMGLKNRQMLFYVG